MVLFILMVVIGGQEVDQNCDEALCFRDLNRCLFFAERLNQQPEAPEITAHCRHINTDIEARWYK